MSTLLQLNTSLFGENGQSSALTRRFVDVWRESHPTGRVIVRDLARSPVPHLDAPRARALFSQPADRTPAQHKIVSESDTLIAELTEADIIVIGLPLYNFGVPSTLKAYFDHVARVGVTFRYTADGPEGLLGNRKVYVFAARGGAYRDTPADTQTPFVMRFLSFLGIDDVEFVYAEGLNISSESKERALSNALATVERLAA